MVRVTTRALFAGGSLLAFIAGIQLFVLAAQTDVYLAWVIQPPLSLVLPIAQARPALTPASPAPPVPSKAKTMLALQGAVMLVVEAAVFLGPQAAASLWPWKVTTLTARALASWQITTGILAWVAIRREDYVSPDVAGISYGAIGARQLAALARFAGDVDWDQPAGWVFALFVASIRLADAYIWYRARLDMRTLGQPVEAI
jgi:hypothetical protein